MSEFHTPVMKAEVLAALNIKPNRLYVDATLGGGGHSQAIIEKGGVILGIDQDPEAIDEARKRLESACSGRYNHVSTSIFSPNLANKALGKNAFSPFTVVRGNFNSLQQIIADHNFHPISGILFDLGASNYQLTSPTRGFSFQHNAPLDMRMDPELAVTARDLVNALGKKELYDLFTKFAQEKRARAIAAAITSARSQKPLETTTELAEIISQVYGRRIGKLHPATKAFQALRIAVNDELNALKSALPQALSLLEPHGRLVAISFHEGEDRMVKTFLRNQAEMGTMTVITKKPLIPTPAEMNKNPRSRSAKLRIAEKI